jgi:hypothetical protein
MSTEKHINDIKEIRSLMERSTRFVSLSGLSGIMAGIYALIGAYLANNYLQSVHYTTNPNDYFELLVIALAVMSLALVTGALLTFRKAKQNNQSIWGKSALRMLAYIAFPMVVGGFFCLAMALNGGEMFIAGGMLIFYGLGLINGSKYTFNDIRVLGVVNVILGILALFSAEYALVLWALGFGLMHIVYGIFMHFKYERKQQ